MRSMYSAASRLARITYSIFRTFRICGFFWMKEQAMSDENGVKALRHSTKGPQAVYAPGVY
jgi:hypothetical protein